MIDYNKELVAALSKILPTHYELSLHSGLETPCYSYQELNNYSLTEVINATVGWSRIGFRVKVWGHNISDLQKYALAADNALRPLGFKRTSSGELYDYNSAMIQKILTYEALASEEY